MSGHILVETRFVQPFGAMGASLFGVRFNSVGHRNHCIGFLLFPMKNYRKCHRVVNVICLSYYLSMGYCRRDYGEIHISTIFGNSLLGTKSTIFGNSLFGARAMCPVSVVDTC